MIERTFLWSAVAALALAAASGGSAQASDPISCRSAGRADGERAVLHEPLAAVHRIGEPDLLTVIETIAASPWGAARHRAELVQAKRRLASWADEPPSASRLPKADQAQKQFLRAPFAVNDPALAPLKDAFAGFARRYVFIDAADPAERAYALAELDRDPAVRVAALSGPLTPLREACPQTRFYFDQGGALRRLFKLRAHPSTVLLTAEGALVRTVVLEGDGRPAPENDDPVKLPEASIPVPADVRAAALDAARLLQTFPLPPSDSLKKVRP